MKKRTTQLLSKEQEVQECDATKVDNSDEVWKTNKLITLMNCGMDKEALT
jgi:hypothetical protein